MKSRERNRHLEPCDKCGQRDKVDGTHVCKQCITDSRSMYAHTRRDNCPNCGGPLIRINTQNLKICNDCKLRIENPLKPGQVSDL
jgi:hypothetical protein